MTIDNVFDRYCHGEDVELTVSQQALSQFHNDVFAHKRQFNWADITQLEMELLQAALRAGYRMALRDMRARIEEVGIG